jgi:hypothetical protein
MLLQPTSAKMAETSDMEEERWNKKEQDNGRIMRQVQNDALDGRELRTREETGE